MRKFIVLIVGLLFSVSVVASEVNEDNVEKMIERIDRAINALDANSLAKELSDDVEIIINVTIGDEEQVMTPSKVEYIDMLEQGWANYENYSYTRSVLNVDVQDGQALVYAEINESLEFQGQKISVESQEHITIKIVEGKPLVTNIVGYTSM